MVLAMEWNGGHTLKPKGTTNRNVCADAIYTYINSASILYIVRWIIQEGLTSTHLRMTID